MIALAERKHFPARGIALCLMLAAGLPAAARETTELSQAGVQAAFQILRRDYIRAGDLDFATLNRAALDGLLSHLQAGARLVPVTPQTGRPAAEPHVLSAVLAEKIGWARPLSYAPAEVALLEEALEKLRGAGCSALLLDLRQPAPDAAFETAAGMLDLFVPPGRTMFRLAQSGKQEAELFLSTRGAAWPEGPVIALVDGGTNNVGEAVAAVLRDQRLALLIGEGTRGATARYQTLPLDETHALQYASAEMLLPDGASLFQKGLKPDLEVIVPAEARPETRRLMAQGRVRELVHETARPRFNEAALVARRNPELESYLRRSQEGGDKEDRLPVTDAVLQRAVDLLQTRQRLEGFQLNWDPPSKPPAAQDEPETRRATPVSGSPGKSK